MLILTIVGYVLLGLFIVLAAAAVIPWLIVKENQHDQATCGCWDCRNRRVRALLKWREKQGQKEQQFPPKPGDPPLQNRNSRDFWSTEQLRTGYHIRVKGGVYEVTYIKTMADGASRVSMVNISTRQDTWALVPLGRKHLLYWRKAFSKDLYL